ncbi:MAG: hypothetical protein QM804_08185 [Propionicimonas sp.]
MTESRETFEPYPFNPDGPEPQWPQDPPPPELQPRVVAPPPVTSNPSRPDGVGRRVVLGVALSVGALLAVGVVANSAAQLGSGPTMTASPFDEDGEPVETGYAELVLDAGSIGVELPAGWTATDEASRLLLVTHEQGWLAARSPERAAATRNDLAREAAYLREMSGFDAGEDTTSYDDESDDQLTVLVLTTTGHFGGQPATEVVTLLMPADPDVLPDELGGQSLVISRVWVDDAVDVLNDAEFLYEQLRSGFESL